MAGLVVSLLSLLLLVFTTGYPTNKDDVDGSRLLQTLLPVQQPVEQRGSVHPGVTLAITRSQPFSPETPYTPEDELQGDDTDVRHRRAANTTVPTDSVAEASEMVESEGEQVADSQHFFPSFSPIFPPLGHSRPPFYQEPVYNPRPAYKPHDSFGFGSGTFRDYSFAHAPAESERSSNVLGSGNFGVLRGGTYYPGENDELLNDDIYNNYYHGNNGHGRPSYYPANPLPTFRQGGDFFANFKDFADISTPTKSSYSEFYVVYVNPNSTSGSELQPVVRPGDSAPKNIFEQLQYLDAATEPQTKLSKAKLKLEKYKTHHQTKENTKKQKGLTSPKELYEPLLALS
ncbi:uncharacterized protein LOC124352737 [Homalodisca vitripennis]|uniref:uncharacterized protein LOC124352737 n=1 Tax=Homalodisca vitripennis TaxID=197043 RepID=UPI001EEC14CC|nr:uncharacterized protein LOC124352737 [Homalodisca vitripennis]